MNDITDVNAIIRNDLTPRPRPPRRPILLGLAAAACLFIVVAGASLAAAQTSVSPSAAVQSVVQLANDEQQRAFWQNDPTIMSDTATVAYYNQLVQIDAQLRSSGVTAIRLVSVSFDQIAVTGTTANVTTTETWQATFADGSTVNNTSQNDYALVLVGGAWKIASDTQPNANVAPSTTTGGQPPSSTVGTTSRNWSGYIASGGTFTAVSGTWIVPTVSATSAGADATWVGIGGATTTDLIQAGTQATVAQGVVQYEAWVETLPQPSQTVPLTINAGDSITVSLTQQSSGLWAISIKDTTSGQSYSTTITYASSLSSAEWIEEAPSAGRGTVPLDAFGTTQFTSGSTALNGQTVSAVGAGATAITMTDRSGSALATPSALGANGSSFTVTRA